jgi:hypothetical protein
MKKRFLTIVTASVLLLGAYAAVKAPSNDVAELPSVYSTPNVVAELPSVYKAPTENAAELPSVYSKELPSVY